MKMVQSDNHHHYGHRSYYSKFMFTLNSLILLPYIDDPGRNDRVGAVGRSRLPQGVQP
jgi:hypothetical protein